MAASERPEAALPISETAVRRGRLLKAIRRYELELMAGHLPEGGKVLELGGGDGYQASILASKGYAVTSLEVALPGDAPLHHPLVIFDGRHIPAADTSFDAVFSSNVLEHVIHLDDLLADTKRVLKPGGIAVHSMPTPSWSFWTSITFGIGFVARALAARRERSVDVGKGGTETAPTHPRAHAGQGARGSRWNLREMLVAPPHGAEAKSAWQELSLFRKVRWVATLDRNGFDVRAATGMDLFYTGDLLLVRLPLSARRWLAPALGPSCRLYCGFRR